MAADASVTTAPAPAGGPDATSPPRTHRMRALVLFAALFCLAQIPAPDAFLGTDTGAKAATLEAMARRARPDPDIGYWAADVDPDGIVHPFRHTIPTVDGRWVDVTTLPLLLVAWPLQMAGGPRLALAVPVAGAVAAAWAVSALAARLAAPGRAERARRDAFWVAGAASPLVIYALDLWEHTWGAALMVGGVVAVLDTLTGRPGAPGTRGAALAGLAFGLAATMRQEALVYGAMAGLVLLLVGGRRRGWARAATWGSAMAATTVAVLAVNAVLDWALIGEAARVERGVGTVGLVGSDLSARLADAFVTAAGFSAGTGPAAVATGLALVSALVVVGLVADRTSWPRRWALALVVAVLLAGSAPLLGGLRFVPGLAATTPLAVAGVARAGRVPGGRWVAAVAVGGALGVWATGYLGGAGPQWGGRYLLTTGACGIALAAATAGTPAARRALGVLAAASVLVTGVGVAWTVQRTHSVAAAMTRIAARDEVVVFEDGFLAREGGARVLDARWLAVPEGATPDAPELVRVLDELGASRVVLVERERGREPSTLGGRPPVALERVRWAGGLELRLGVYERDPAG